ncbi:MAG: hypothetical protein M1828_004099 [Chrysothrix sp. TS-e1954]|nr:MAG: hypothetical protein M1828_004099 [Chrysothrix sp. TS-e1954]
MESTPRTDPTLTNEGAQAPTTSSVTRDPTFLRYTLTEAQAYLRNRTNATPPTSTTDSDPRPAYNPALYAHILHRHISSGGQLGTLLDVGCGPGGIARDLARLTPKLADSEGGWKEVWGIDGSSAMTGVAKRVRWKTANGGDIKWACLGAEDLDQLIIDHGVKEGSVDLIVVGMAAHWFDMPLFWEHTARLLRPGGTVALFTRGGLYCHPTTPSATQVQAHLTHLEETLLAPYRLYGNTLSSNLYRDLPLPHRSPNLTSPSCDIDGFDADATTLETWDKDGIIDSGREDFFSTVADDGWTTLSGLKAHLGSASMVTRYRAANPRLARTEQDYVESTMRRIRETLNDASGSEDAEVWLRVGAATALVTVKRSAT